MMRGPGRRGTPKPAMTLKGQGKLLARVLRCIMKNYGVHFKYHTEGSGDDILEDINLHIESGETIGIIGGTGCGKTTLDSLISRL